MPHDWPFNVRELALLARRLLALHPDAAVLDLEMLSPSAPAPTRARRAWRRRTTAVARRKAAAVRIRIPRALVAALRAERGNVKRTAPRWASAAAVSIV